MVDALVDTSIVIDLFRKYQPATSWFQQSDEVLGLTYYTWLEVVEGCSNKREQRLAIISLGEFNLVPITDDDAEWATDQLIALNLRLNIDKIDCLIGATNHRLQIPLYTRNIKHFKPLLGNLAVRPY